KLLDQIPALHRLHEHRELLISDSLCNTSKEIRLLTKLCYAVGGVPYAITMAAINISLQIFLLDVVQVNAFYVSMILFVSRAWDAVTDPLIGYLVSRSRWTPVGKLTPWLVVSAPLAILSYLLLWFVPPASVSGGSRMLWFLAAACMFETLMSCYNVPYLSLNMFLGGDQRDRDSATAYRMSVEVVAMLLASVIQGQVVSVYNAEKQEACEELDSSHQTALLGTSSPQSASLQETVQSRRLTLTRSQGYTLTLSFTVLRRGHCCAACVDECSCVRHVVMLSSPSALSQMSLGNFALFCTHAAELGDHFQQLLLILLVSASVAVPLWQVVLLRIGKKATVFIGLSVRNPGFTLFHGNTFPHSECPPHLPMSIPALHSCSDCRGLSMLPDVVDDFAVRHPSCKDLEPLFFSCYAFCSKLAGGLSVGLSTMTLQFVGYKAGACNHDDRVVLALILLFSPVPIALLLVGMAFFHSYPINERQSFILYWPLFHFSAFFGFVLVQSCRT
uniref:Zgc:171501 n=1 Tax=Salarias fasciatus TaxID=181472 RepID=A0A672JGA2_SALFA